jgi:hypothetical protein
MCLDELAPQAGGQVQVTIPFHGTAADFESVLNQLE